MNDKLQQTLEQIEALDAELAATMVRYGEEFKAIHGYEYPLPDDGNWLDLGRYGDGTEQPEGDG